MSEIEMLNKLAQDIGGEWKNLVLVENKTDNAMIDAYNEGVRAMASQCCGLIKAIADGKMFMEELERDGTRAVLDKVGEQK